MKNKMITLVLIFMFCFNTASYAFSLEDAAEVFKGAIEDIVNYYIGSGYEELTEEALATAAMKGMFSVLDDYSEYYTLDEYKSFMESSTGQFFGVGIVITPIDGSITVVEVIPNSPAEKAGIQKDDILLSVEGEAVTGYTTEKVALLVKGEVNTNVNLVIKRGGDEIKVTLTRQLIKVNPVVVQMIDEVIADADPADQIGYIKISEFNANMLDYLIPELERLKKEGVTTLVLDLRNNFGGILEETLGLSSYFMNRGLITTLVDKTGEQTEYVSLSEANFDKIVLLVNKYSASATELFAGALRDTKRAIIVGETTFGKGVAQRLLFNPKGGAYKLTMEEYLTPLGDHLNNKGVAPDVEFVIPDYIYDITTRYYYGDQDANLIKAKRILIYLGYPIANTNDQFDQALLDAICAFQSKMGLYVYGGLDYTTQRSLNTALYEEVGQNDRQLRKAWEVAKYYNEFKR